MNRNLAQAIAQYPVSDRIQDVIKLGGSISQNPDFYPRRRAAVDAFVETYEEYTVAPVIQACTYHANLCALVNWLQEETNGNFYRTSSKQEQD